MKTLFWLSHHSLPILSHTESQIIRVLAVDEVVGSVGLAAVEALLLTGVQMVVNMSLSSQSLDLSQHPDTGRFLLLLKKISDLADKEHIKGMKFLLMTTITPKNLEKCEDMMDIFTRLKQKALLTPDRLEYLKDLVFKTWGDNIQDISNIFDEYEGRRLANQRVQLQTEHSSRSSSDPTTLVSRYSPTMRSSTKHSMLSASTQASYASSLRSRGDHTLRVTLPPRFQQVFEHTASRLGADWQVLARVMDIAEARISDIDAESKAYDKSMLVLMDWYSKQNKPSVTTFRRLLKAIPRNDIADDIKEMFQSKQS